MLKNCGTDLNHTLKFNLSSSKLLCEAQLPAYLRDGNLSDEENMPDLSNFSTFNFNSNSNGNEWGGPSAQPYDDYGDLSDYDGYIGIRGIK